jgi:hypothetical protein
MSFLNFLKRLLAEIKLGKGMTGFSKPRAHPLTQICNDRWSCVMNVTESETYSITLHHFICHILSLCPWFKSGSRIWDPVQVPKNKVIRWRFPFIFFVPPSWTILHWTQVQSISPPAIQTCYFDSPPSLQEITTSIRQRHLKQDAAHEPECSHVCSHAQYLSAIVYLNSLVHVSLVTVPVCSVECKV